uniref:PCNA-associated factor n=1 Tax=Urocitellus parryii TaxID=9999 RepID=A0A8D2HJV3_UROPR
WCKLKADSIPSTYRKVVASQAPRKFVMSNPKRQKGIGEILRLSPKDFEKENQIPEEAGSSSIGKAKRKKYVLYLSTEKAQKH